MSCRRLNEITIGLLCVVIFYLMRQYVQTHRAIRWWQQRQSNWRYAESERLRDTTLQALFGIRRQLELMAFQENSSAQEVLPIMQQCQQDLNQLSDRLFSPYAADNLVLAVMELLDEMKTAFPHIAFNTRSEQTNPDLIQGDCHFLVTWLRELLQTLLVATTVKFVVVQLVLLEVPQRVQVQVQVQIACADRAGCLKLHRLPALNYLCQTFNVLTGGRCQINVQDTELRCSVCWPPPPRLPIAPTNLLRRHHEQVSDFSH